MSQDNTKTIADVIRERLKRVYFNGSTDVIARKNGVIPNDTRLGEVQIEVELEYALQSIEDIVKEVIGNNFIKSKNPIGNATYSRYLGGGRYEHATTELARIVNNTQNKQRQRLAERIGAK